MSIIAYEQQSTKPDVHTFIKEVNAQTSTTRALLTAIGDFWTEYYGDTEILAQAVSGHGIMVSKEYTHLLRLIKSTNILTIPVEHLDQFTLCAIDLTELEPVTVDNEVSYYLLRDTTITSAGYLCTTLFESPVVLEDGIHYQVIPNEGIRFYVDLANDKTILKYAYRQNDRLLFWVCDIALQSTIIYQRFGRFLYAKTFDSEKYQWFITGIMKYFTSTKTTDNLRQMLDILYGIPYTRYDNETIVKIANAGADLEILDHATGEDPYIAIVTDKATYYTYSFSEICVQVGDIVPRFKTLATFHEVVDYIDEPYWWLETGFPTELIASDDCHYTENQKNALMEHILKYNTFHIKISVTFETYSTYRSQILKLKKLIRGGVPIYLYPVMRSVFKAYFEDIEEFSDKFERITAKTYFVEVHKWSSIIYNGERKFYPEPLYRHGSACTAANLPTQSNTDCTLIPLKYNGDHPYYHLTYFGQTRRHMHYWAAAHLYNGEAVFSGDAPIKHLYERETFSFDSLKLVEQTDSWNWSEGTNAYTFYTKYDHTYKHKSTLRSGKTLVYGKSTQVYEDNNPLSIKFYCALDDFIGLPYDDIIVLINTQDQHSGTSTYNNTILYNGSIIELAPDIGSTAYTDDIPTVTDGNEDILDTPRNRTWVNNSDNQVLPEDTNTISTLVLSFNETVQVSDELNEQSKWK